MLWLAAYPGSGSSYLRRILRDVYGIESSSFHNDPSQALEPDYASFPVCTTHVLPGELIPKRKKFPAVYLVRDGRDCVVAAARRQKQSRNDDFDELIREVIDAAEGSYFGGWSEHVRQWTDLSALVLRYENLIRDPVACLEQLRPWLDLPQPNLDRIPAVDDRDDCLSAGRWRGELSHALHLRFAARHGSELIRLGYIKVPRQTEAIIRRSEEADVPRAAKKRKQTKKRILIDGLKLLDDQMDGIHRYVRELLEAMHHVVQTEHYPWQIDVSLGYAGIKTLEQVVSGAPCDGLPTDTVPDLMQADQRNPMHRSRERLRHIPKRKFGKYIAEALRFKMLGLARSVLKRYLKLRHAFRPKEKPYDLVHLTLPNTWHWYRESECRVLMTVHDLSHLVCPQFQTRSNVETLADGLKWAEERDASYISVSQATRNQMVELLGIPEERIDVVLNSVKSQTFRPVSDPQRLADLRKSYNIPDGKVLLCLGTIEPRKNLRNIIAGFRTFLEKHPQPDLTLVLAGGRGWENHQELQKSIKACPQIRYIGYVDEHDIAALYTTATALCYVSLYEGFGLPILEAMACGTPVIYGDNSSMPEIAGNAGVPAVATDPESIAAAMRQIVCNEEFRNELSIQAILRAHSMSWVLAARQTLRCYRRAMSLGNVAPSRDRRQETVSIDAFREREDAAQSPGSQRPGNEEPDRAAA